MVCIDIESFPTGILIPNFGHKSIPTAFTDSNKAKSFSLSPAAAIQLADNFICSNVSIELATIFVIASPIAILAEAGALDIAIGDFSPIAKDSPRLLSKSDFVTATLLTGICHGPTI